MLLFGTTIIEETQPADELNHPQIRKIQKSQLTHIKSFTLKVSCKIWKILKNTQ